MERPAVLTFVHNPLPPRLDQNTPSLGSPRHSSIKLSVANVAKSAIKAVQIENVDRSKQC